MAKAQKKRKKPVEKPAEMFQPKDFLDRIAPAAVKFNTDSYVLGGLYRCVLALRGYPAATEELALLSHICNRAGVTLHLYTRQVTAAEEDAIYHKAVNKNRLNRSSQDNLKRSVTAEAKRWDVGDDRDDDPTAPNAFRQQPPLSQHISFLKDFFRAYKPFTHQQVDTLELMLERLYRKWGISDKTDFSAMGPEDWPIAEDLYAVLEDAYEHYDREDSPLYPRELLRELLLGLHSMCRGAESVYFNGRTNITSARFLVFGVKDLIHANSSVKDALLFNLLSYLSDQLLTKGSTVAALDELYLWLSNLTTIEYIRNCLKRVRKRDSALILASQNLEDFDVQGVRELTRPLFAIPTHQFLFHGGKVDKKFYMDNLQLESAEYDLIRSPQRGVCLFKSGADRNLLDVHAPPHKHALVTGGRG